MAFFVRGAIVERGTNAKGSISNTVRIEDIGEENWL
jgi:hypothetical protein